MLLLLAAAPDWMPRIAWVERVLALPWWRIHTLYVGEKLALGALLAVTLVGAVAATDRLFAGNYGWPKQRRASRTSKRKKGIGVKWVVMALIALLPGGLVGMAAVYAVMGRENWRRDALKIVGMSLVPAVLLGLLRLEQWPWPDMRDAVYVSGLLGLIFGLLHVWALVKLLRQWWGEPDECVPWWPPAALCLQIVMLTGAVIRLLEP
jgi:hypothetical protein